MKKNASYLLAAIAFTGIFAWACNKPEPAPDPEPEPVDLVDLTLSVPVTDNWVFIDKPNIIIHVENPNAVAVEAEASVRFSTDLKVILSTVEKTVTVPANGEMDIPFTTDGKLDPGFYKAACFVNKKSAKNFVFGINPTEIVSAPDKQADFDKFWADAKAQLESIEMKPNLIEIPKKSNEKCKVYFVEIQSVPDGIEGDPVTVRGYYLEPQDGKTHPVIMHFMGYDTMGTFVSCPGGNNGDYAEFYLSHRGQYINRAPANKRADGVEQDFENIYGDWFAFNFGNKDGYYYRGAFMDCVQAVRFMATRSTSDMDNLFAEGSSQGGALTYATAALSDYPFTAIAPCVAFLGDYPDYFQIVSWPGDTAKSCAKKAGMSDEEMYAFLSYFDTKNLATRISCPVIACSNLQDGTCPPHTNLAPYNNLASTDKEIYFYPLLQHVIPSDWPAKYTAFFKARIK
jgi:cephalosporin-C deacetylase-like acetyl esterase